jgi:uncharacterized protein YjbI with pentapeptide repeats
MKLSRRRKEGIAFALVGVAIIAVSVVVYVDFIANAGNPTGPPLSQSAVCLDNPPPYDCPYTNLKGADLSGKVLSYSNFTGSDLTGADFDSSDLTNVSLANAIVTNTNFTHANLYGADLSGANINSAILCDTTLPDGTSSNADCS